MEMGDVEPSAEQGTGGTPVPSEPPQGSSGGGAMSTQSLYAALGLSPEDVDTLAQIPESEISVETLPYLIMELKAKRAKQGDVSAATPPPTAASRESKPERAERRAADTDGPTRRSGSRGADHDQEHHGKGNGHRRAESGAGRRDSRHTKSSKERLPASRSPEKRELDDFRGALPQFFPHKCSLCNSAANSSMQWKEHVNGSRHKDACHKFLIMYPDVDRHDPAKKIAHSGEDDSYSSHRSSRSSQPHKRPYSTSSAGDLSFSPGDPGSLKHMPNTRVVVAKFPMGTVTVKDLLSLAKPFGTVVKHLVLPSKGFLEFSTHKEAQSMVSHYLDNLSFFKGQKLTLYLSPMVESIHMNSEEPAAKRFSSAVVLFTHVPPGERTEAELLEVASMFGEVRQSIFLNNRVLVEMANWRDANLMVKYYNSHPLKIGGKSVKVSPSNVRTLWDTSHSGPSSRGGDSSKRHGSHQRSQSSSRTSHSSSKERSGHSKEVTEGGEESQEKAQEPEEEAQGEKEQEEEEVGEEKREEMWKELEEGDDDGIQVVDEQGLLEEEFGHSEEEDNVARDTEKEETTEGEKVEADEEERMEEETQGAGDPAPPEEEGEEEKVAEEPALLEEQEVKDTAMEQENEEEMEFPDNLDDFVTLDELDSTAGGDFTFDSEEPQNGRVVVVTPIRKSYDLKDALEKLAEPFGKVVNFEISYYKGEALLELESAELAERMVKHYKAGRSPKLCQRPVKISICHSQQRLESPSGRSIYIDLLPFNPYSDIQVLRLARPFGNITGYYLNRGQRKCYIQMETAEQAKRMIQHYLHHRAKFLGSRLWIRLYMKADSQIPWRTHEKFKHWRELGSQRSSPSGCEEMGTEDGQSAKSSTAEDHRTSVSDCEGVCGEPLAEEPSGISTETEPKQRTPLGPYDPNNPVGLDYVVPRSGFFCKLCNVFYTSEQTAKSLHCSSQEHYERLKERLGENTEDRSTE